MSRGRQTRSCPFCGRNVREGRMDNHLSWCKEKQELERSSDSESADTGGVERKRCKNCGRLKDADDFWKNGICNSCGKSLWTQKCPRCDSTSITSETKDNPKGYETHASGTITVYECNECGFRSGFRHDWKWE